MTTRGSAATCMGMLRILNRANNYEFSRPMEAFLLSDNERNQGVRGRLKEYSAPSSRREITP